MNKGLKHYGNYFETLRENNLFVNLKDDVLESLLQISTSQKWPKKTCVLDTNHTLHKFYILISGKIKEYNYENIHNRELIHAILTKNDVFNVCTLLNGRASSFYYEVLSSSELICVPMDKMRLWMKENPKINRSIMKHLAMRMEVLENKVFDFCSLDISTRLAKLLFEHWESDTKKTNQLNGLKNSDMAALIGTTRAVLNRHLQEFKEEGIIQIENRNLKILNEILLFQRLYQPSISPHTNNTRQDK